MHIVRGILFVSILLALLIVPSSTDVSAAGPCGGPGCVLDPDPDPWPPGGGSCPEPADAASCMARCDCIASAKVAACSNDFACISAAMNQKADCEANCYAQFGNP